MLQYVTYGMEKGINLVSTKRTSLLKTEIYRILPDKY